MLSSWISRGAAAAIAALLAACSPQAPAAEPNAETNTAEAPDTGPGPKGLPMWVIKDADSTIYLTGTVHAMRPGLDWKSKKLLKAMDESKELWVEVPMPSDQNKMMAEHGGMMLRKMYIFTRPLSSLLTPNERVKLREAIVRAKLPPEQSQSIEVLRPWAATQMIGMGPLLASGYDPNQGIDINLVRIAEEQGDAVRGFETFEQQMNMLSSAPEEEQLKSLREVLNMPAQEADEMQAKAEAAFEAWAKGDPAPVEALFSDASVEEALGGMDLDIMLYNRNADWANQVEKLLAGKGVSFIAVGAGHVVGPKNLRDLLAARGIVAQPY
jgi:uncharacterized protein